MFEGLEVRARRFEAAHLHSGDDEQNYEDFVRHA